MEEHFTKTAEPVCEDDERRDIEKLHVSKGKDITESTFTPIKEPTTPVEIKHEEKEHDSSLESVSGIEKDDRANFKEEKGHPAESPALSPILHSSGKTQNESVETGSSVKEESVGNTLWNVNMQDSGELSIRNEDTSNSSEENMINIAENIKTKQVDDTSKTVKEDEGKMDVIADNVDDEVIGVKEESQNSFSTFQENESSNDTRVCDSNTSAELHQEQTDSLEAVAVAPKIETNVSVDSKPPERDSAVPKIKTSKGPKIKRTLSRAERLSRTRKAKSGLSLKIGFKVSPLKVSPPSKQADAPGVSLPPKGAPPVKTSIKSEKTVQRRRSSKGSRSSSISPRGYGYSMAFMDMEKPGPPVGKSEPETEVPLPDSGITTVHISIPSTACTAASPTSPASSTETPTENPPAPKKQTYQAKKFRLDQITGKLSAQRQSEAKAAAQSPSAFQLAKHHSPPPPPPPQLSPSPPANPPPPYPRESYAPPGPPPLIYSPMPGACCPPPHHQHMYGPHPARGMHLPAGHMRPHPDYPPPSSGYMLYAHGMHYPPPPGPCIGQCKSLISLILFNFGSIFPRYQLKRI